MQSLDPPELRELRERVRELEQANHQLILHDQARQYILDHTVQLLATAIVERNHWYRKANGDYGFKNRD